MECEMCGQEVANSEELQRHRERLHPYPDDRGDSAVEGGEKPDLIAPEPETADPEPALKRH
jgi:hypothetical protein